MIQGSGMRVLECFLTQDTLNFAQLCKAAGYTTDLGGYYIRQLMRGGYLKKGDRGEYTILPKGKQELAQYYGTHRLVSRPRLVLLLVVASQGGRFVAMKRIRQPFINRVEWVAAAINGQETLAEAARRTAKVRLGVDNAEPQLVGFFRRIDMFKDSLFDDKLFAVHRLDLAEDTPVIPASEMGSLALYTQEELERLPTRSRALLDILRFVQKGGGTYEEHFYELDEADLGD